MVETDNKRQTASDRTGASLEIAVVIVNYKTPKLVMDCLESLEPEIAFLPGTKVFIGDAASGDGSVAEISEFIKAKGFGPWATCFDIGTNGGFAFGNNHIIKAKVLPDPSFEFVHFLNPDTYIHRGAVTELAAHLDANRNVAIAGSRLENPDGSLRAYGFRFPTPIREFFRGARIKGLSRRFPGTELVFDQLTETQEVDWVSGASFMMRRDVLETVGLMDDGYFLYFEETDLMKRVRKAGYAIWHVSESCVVHIAGAATGMRAGDAKPKRVPHFWLQSRTKFFRDHFGWAGLFLANAMFLVGDLVYRGHRLIRLKPLHNPPKMWRDYVMNTFSLPPGRT